MITSKRRYVVQITEGGHHYDETIELKTLLTTSKKNEYEYIYSMQDLIDEVLDLKDGESMYFKPNRDNDLAKGIITRID